MILFLITVIFAQHIYAAKDTNDGNVQEPASKHQKDFQQLMYLNRQIHTCIKSLKKVSWKYTGV